MDVNSKSCWELMAVGWELGAVSCGLGAGSCWLYFEFWILEPGTCNLSINWHPEYMPKLPPGPSGLPLLAEFPKPF
jgi:hypothetical protein